MGIKTELNLSYIETDLWHELKLNNVTQLFNLADMGVGYVSQLRARRKRGETLDVKLGTVDRLANAVVARMVEIGKSPPDDLWRKLIVQVEE